MPITYRKLWLLLLAMLMNAAFATPAITSGDYQIDLIILTNDDMPKPGAFVLPPNDDNVVPIPGSDNINSGLETEYKTLSDAMRDKILLHLSWVQPQDFRHYVALPAKKNADASIRGNVKITRGTWYNLETDLIVTDSHKNQFSIKHKRRLKPETVYYIDHPAAGMLIKIHKIT